MRRNIFEGAGFKMTPLVLWKVLEHFRGFQGLGTVQLLPPEWIKPTETLFLHQKSELIHYSLFIFHCFQGQFRKFDFLKKGPKTDFNFCCMLLASSNTVRNHHPFDWSQKINLNFVQDQCDNTSNPICLGWK